MSVEHAPIDEGNRLQAFFYAVQECLRSALGSIRSHRMRSFLTMLGVIIGVASVICVVSLLQGLTRSVMNEFQGIGGNTLQIRSDTSQEDRLIGKWNKLRPADLELVKYRVAGISNVTPMTGLNLPGGVRNGSNTAGAQVFATTSWFQLANQSFPRLGRFITDSDNDSRRRVVESRSSRCRGGASSSRSGRTRPMWRSSPSCTGGWPHRKARRSSPPGCRSSATGSGSWCLPWS